MTAIARPARPPLSPTSFLSRRARRWTAGASLMAFATVILSAFLMPLAYMVSTALKEKEQITQPGAPPYPASPETFAYEGQDYPIYIVPTADGEQRWALVKKGREESSFVDPANPENGPIVWQGRWRTLERAWRFDPHVDNFATAWRLIDFGRLLRNTAVIALLGTLGAVTSAIAVAYGFARFRIPGKNVLFIILIATIILPSQVTLIPSFVVFTAIGWTGTWLPLIVPHFFANAYNVFLLRQYFMTIPRDLDEAAMMDGASPFRVLVSVIVPQSIPAITAVALFHFFFAWNDFFLPLIYLQGNRELQPLAVGIQEFNALYAQEPTLIQASALMTLVIPMVVFLLGQRAFMRGVVMTGVEK